MSWNEYTPDERDPWASKKSNPYNIFNCKNFLIWVLLFIVFVFAVMFVTVPTQAEQKEANTQVLIDGGCKKTSNVYIDDVGKPHPIYDCSGAKK